MNQRPDFPERIAITPFDRPIDATVVIPGSKSITNRALLVAALAVGDSTLTGALYSDDTRYMSEGLTELGIPVDSGADSVSFLVRGQGGSIPAGAAELFVGNAGTAMRFLVAALTLGSGRYRIDGVPRMRQRPILPLLSALNDLGGDAISERGTGCPPVIVNAAGLYGGRTKLDGEQSSQYFSALLMAAPMARTDVVIEVVGDLVSRPYVSMTAAVMADFGVVAELDTVEWREFRVRSDQRYQGRAYHIEPDASNASYFFAAAAITGGRVRVEGLNHQSTQGDLDFVDVLASMGASVTFAENAVEVQGPPGGALRGVDVDMNAISDTAQSLAAIAPFAAGSTTIRGVHHARLKETDRVAAMATELRRMGQLVEEHTDGLTITPSAVLPAAIETYDDHRMAMAFSVTGLRANGIQIIDPGCVAKTFPDFYQRLESMR